MLPFEVIVTLSIDKNKKDTWLLMTLINAIVIKIIDNWYHNFYWGFY